MSAEQEGLGVQTIMDPALAARHGVPYVHLAAFAIDVDRVLELAGDEDSRPFGWEVFLTEVYMLSRFDPRRDEHRALIEDACLGLLESDPGDALLGAQLPFAVYDAVHRGVWPAELGEVFRGWRGRGARFAERLAPIWEHTDERARSLALSCLDAALSPPLAPPTREALEAIVAAPRPIG